MAVFIDHADAVKLADCVDLTKYLQSALGEDLEARELEVSSPGMDEPLESHPAISKKNRSGSNCYY